jgi:hypothetical protein
MDADDNQTTPDQEEGWRPAAALPLSVAPVAAAAAGNNTKSAFSVETSQAEPRARPAHRWPRLLPWPPAFYTTFALADLMTTMFRCRPPAVADGAPTRHTGAGFEIERYR